jgi:hypothetical protein
MVANFITDGILPMPQETLKRHVPENIGAVFQSFGIFLEQVLNNSGESLLLPSINVKTELNILKFEDVKKELLEHEVKLEDSNLIHDIIDNNVHMFSRILKLRILNFLFVIVLEKNSFLINITVI